MSRSVVVALLLAVLGIGGFLRLHRLDYPTMGGDVMVYYSICESGVRPAELLVHSPKYLGDLPPLWFAAHNWFLQTLGLEVNFRNVRLPDALVGILTILAAFGAGRAAGGRRAGLLAALFVAIQPLHVQMSRECYFYAPIVLGCFLALWAVLHLADRLERRQPQGPVFYLLAFAGFLLLSNVQISSWNFAALFAVTLYVLLVPPALRGQRSWRPVVVLTLGFFLIGCPSLLSEWGMRDAIKSLFGERKDYWQNIFGERLGNPWIDSGRIFFAYLTGSGGFRIWTSLLCVLAGIGAIAGRWKSDRKIRVFGGFAATTILLLVTLHMKSPYPMENRHYANLFPLLVIGSCLGFLYWADRLGVLLARGREARPAAAAAAGLLLLGVNAYPAWMSTQLDWEPPHAAISRWVDRNLPPRSVVLCDRWFNPWNEYRVNPSTNVVYTFTVPNEPVQVYTSSRWRVTAMEFINRNPLAAYLELKSYWTRLSPWTWPHAQYARKQDFVDEYAVRLDQLGLFYRARQLAYPREWNPVTLYYNTEEDLVARARQSGQPLLCLFGTGWEYTKTQDYRDWYALRESATAVVHNLTDAPAQVFLDIAAVATPGAITLTAYAGTNAVFPANQIQTRRLGPIEVAPGRQEIRLANLTRAEPPATLLVQQISAADR